MKSLNVNYLLYFGLIIIAISQIVHCMPAESNDEDQMQADDYYDDSTDEQNAGNQQMKPTPKPKDDDHPKPQPFFIRTEASVTGMIGKDIVLDCEVKNLGDAVILWYKGKTLISTGNNVQQSMYSLNPKNYSLTIINATDNNEGDYYCELLPDKKRMHTHVTIEKQHDVIVPESSKSEMPNSGLVWTLSMPLLTAILSVQAIVLRI